LNFEESEDKILIEFLKGKIKRLESEIDKMKMKKHESKIEEVKMKSEILLPAKTEKDIEIKPKRCTVGGKYLSTEGAIQYFQEVHGLKIARATLYKKHCTQPGTFPGRRSPFGKLVFDPVEIDRYMATGKAKKDEGTKE
jgi:hypothetical protein